MTNREIEEYMKIRLDDELPEPEILDPKVRRAPKRESRLSQTDKKLAVKNALRYIPEKYHVELAKEFYEELETRGRIYGYRFRPHGLIKARPIKEYKGKCLAGKAIQVMIENNLDFDVALYPYELVTYGETGQVCQNWMQYRLIKRYLEEMEEDQTLIVSSGHPLGLFPTSKSAPRVILTNALMVGKYNDNDNWNRAAAIGVSNYGQFTAGGWFYIGSQGIVHGTFSTLLSVAREILHHSSEAMLEGSLFVSSGLGGMSGAQGKAVEMCNGVGIIAEVDESKIELRQRLGWVSLRAESCSEAFGLAREWIGKKKPVSIAYHGNVVDLLEYAVEQKVHIDFMTDQTSCHVAFDGGYCPQGLTFAERSKMLSENPDEFVRQVKKTIRKHHDLIEILRARGTFFFDYGNSLTTTMYEIGITEVCNNGENSLDGFIYPSFVEAFLGPNLFDLGYGPFRWVCLSGQPEDLHKTDQAAMNCIDKDRRYQDYDNYVWIRDAEKNNLVIGSQARILYQDADTRMKIALRFNEMVREGEIGPVMIGRDHMDTGGADAPSRETSNIKDGSNITADMSSLVYAGDAALGMTMISMHNGGGTGIGNSQSCGYGLLLDGSRETDKIIREAVNYDVMCGVARRAWARNKNSMETVRIHSREKEIITLPYLCDENLIDRIVK
ncbi:urocanate hydratase [Clostridium transplantifaecale]|uniref:urocanate hydratase n=1 Tax=Clostridium transplantifaecale TaxID=2479838 RepID=UPI000F634898|nr:urocanate hydratase [Clostridium transplantifaecale]